MAKKRFWQTAWFPGLLVTCLIMLSGWSSLIYQLEWQAYAFGSRLAPSPQPNDRLEIIAIDEASLQKLGEWPWPRSYIARVVSRLGEAGAGTVGLALPLHTTQSEFSVRRINELRENYEGEDTETVKEILWQAHQKLDTDGALENSLQATGNVVLIINHDSDGADSKTGSKQSLQRLALEDVPYQPPRWSGFIPSVLTTGLAHLDRPQVPLARFSEHAPAGHYSEQNLAKYATSMVLQNGDDFIPSFNLLFAAHSVGLSAEDIKFTSLYSMALGNRAIAMDPSTRIYPGFYQSKHAGPVFTTHSFYDIYDNSDYADNFRDKDVLIGITAASLIDPVIVPGADSMPMIEASAHIINNILLGHGYIVPQWSLWAQLAALALVALYLMFVLPGLKFWSGILVSIMFVLIMVNVHLLILMVINHLWLPLMTPTLALVVGAVVVSTRRVLVEKQQTIEQDLFESNQVLGQNLQAQGQLDQAFEKYRKCKINESLLELLYSLGLDYERRRQFAKAELVYQYILDKRPGFRDVKERQQRNREMHSMVGLPKGNHTTQGTLIMSGQGVQNPMLGRYEVVREIGRGAMGLVYEGRDPKISRTVAIKTMALSEEFDEEALGDVKKRFFREAEAAGRLKHPNIVTIYDVGEEMELAYIAMDLLSGNDLSKYRRSGSLLPLNTVLEIMIKVADALDYAHNNNVVHRDIKPHNIIYDESNGHVCVTDFGVACLVDTSSTKTGTMLGSPSYMSPEQASGRKVDGRSDIFSLGTTLFQMATGQLPFKSDSLPALTYKITNEKHTDIRELLPDAPDCLRKIIDKALHKQKTKRYQTAAQLAKALRECLEQTVNN